MLMGGGWRVEFPHQLQSVGLWGCPFKLMNIPKVPNCQSLLNSWAELRAFQPSPLPNTREPESQ